jgi:molybdopterin/thiamine biosynthesis adenylyltransferase
MNERLEALRASSVAGRDVWRPEIFRMTDAEDRSRLDALLASGEVLVVNDTLHSQLKELIRALDPASKFTPASLDEAAKAHLGTVPADHYGVWVFYPWSRCLVHLIEEAEFILVRTDRNRNKITRAEQERLMELKVGVIGLSVGQSVCLTMALERTFGEMRIADFDTLDLSNLNRIRSGLHLLGQRKAVNVAREIAEIDPFLKVTVFTDGITEANLDAFLLEGGKLDVLVDECDSVGIKIRSRIRAKELGIPVVMDTSDRGLIDIERFDLEPDRPIMHGLIAHLDPAKAMEAKTQEDKLPFVIPMTGLDTLSKRMKASMLEIDKTVTTWPQLATSVVLGGAVTGDVIRRMALGQLTRSGRWFVDVEEMIADERVAVVSSDDPLLALIPAPISLGEMNAAAASLPLLEKGVVPLSEFLAIKLAIAGSHAPSGGNSQPWRFLFSNGRLLLFLDPQRAFSTIDPGLRFAQIGLGACIESILLEATKLGINLNLRTGAFDINTNLVAVFQQTNETPANRSPASESLAQFIDKRCTNRRASERSPLSEEDRTALLRSVTTVFPSLDVRFIHEPVALEQLGRICGAAERIRMLNPLCHYDMFKREMRWNKEQAEHTNDGVDVRTLELSLKDETGLGIAADASAIGLVNAWKGGKGLEQMTSKLVSGSAAVAFLCVPDYELDTALLAGRALQRLWLKSTELGLAAQPISAPVFMGVHGLWDRHRFLSDPEHAEAAGLLHRLTQLLELKDHAPLFMLRLCLAEAPTVRSLRRPIEEVFSVHQPQHV